LLCNREKDVTTQYPVSYKILKKGVQIRKETSKMNKTYRVSGKKVLPLIEFLAENITKNSINLLSAK